jgi:hypothetical protein
MWRPGFVGTTCGWTALVLLGLHVLSSPLQHLATLHGFCTPAGCLFPIYRIVGKGSIPDLFVNAIKMPFIYNPITDDLGYGIAFLVVATPPALFVALLGANFWLWVTRQLMRRAGLA